MNIAIVGMGGVGGYCGCRIASSLNTSPDDKCYFIARGPHLEAIKKSGLFLESADGQFICNPELATDNFEELPELDIVIIAVKSYELENVVKQLVPKIKTDTVIIPLLNGADIHTRVRSVIKTGIVLPSCVYIISFIEQPGRVVQKSTSCVIHSGAENEGDDRKDSVKAAVRMFKTAGIRFEWHEDPWLEIWRKFLFIASFGLVTADNDAVVGKVMESAEMSDSIKKIISELRLIAAAEGVELTDEICEKAYTLGYKFDYDSTTSFQRDFRIKGKPDEREIFGAAMIKAGEKYGIETPEITRLYTEICEKKPES
ncbi:MAG: 2-dehydropantoate 2-reductase [Spirochaetales bacterium]|uniref:2-dehydropantoate 2-reductase n=1 Tax=Candidatus Thalassospirochaeta sargassi TaxID=3119039 RepID=A0AAJ1ICY7_9SPIO|nr:2-dehydropantoate 2-reductase [Spirochaetales bacterium]